MRWKSHHRLSSSRAPLPSPKVGRTAVCPTTLDPVWDADVEFVLQVAERDAVPAARSSSSAADNNGNGDGKGNGGDGGDDASASGGEELIIECWDSDAGGLTGDFLGEVTRIVLIVDVTSSEGCA